MTIEARFHIDWGNFSLDVALNLPVHGVTGIFGPSGCGKTTLLRLMAGLEYDPNGYLAISGKIWQKGASCIPTHQRAIGYVFQEASLFSHLTVQGNLKYGFNRIEPSERQITFIEAVELLGLQDFLDRRPGDLSGGERQRVAIARTLLTSPRLLLMDEPLAALDADSKNEIMPFLERLHKNLKIPILYVSHSFDEVARLADHLVLIEAGRVRASGPIAEMINRLDLPLAHAPNAESIVETTIACHDETYGLTHLQFPSGHFTVPHVQLPLGHTVRVRVQAHNVSLTLEHQSGTSILNIFPATILAVTNDHAAQTTVVLDLGEGISILSRITRKSAVTLGLGPGKSVFAQVKSVALLRRSAQPIA